MPTLERRVQVLFDPAQYAALEREAASERQSVGALIREAVDERLNRRRSDKQAALARMLARADAQPDPEPIDWQHEKASFERGSVRDLP